MKNRKKSGTGEIRIRVLFRKEIFVENSDSFQAFIAGREPENNLQSGANHGNIFRLFPSYAFVPCFLFCFVPAVENDQVSRSCGVNPVAVLPDLFQAFFPDGLRTVVGMNDFDFDDVTEIPV
jgi:hypothetical protein